MNFELWSPAMQQAIETLSLALLAVLALRFIEQRMKIRLGGAMTAVTPADRQALERIRELEEEILDYQNRVRVLEDRVDFLLTELTKKNVVPPVAGSTAAPLVRNLLVVIGPDRHLHIDLTAFRKVQQRTGLRFSRLQDATAERLERYLERARVSGYPVRYLHFSVHAGPDGIQLSDRLVDGLWLSERLKDTQVVMIDGCTADAVGDLIGVVPFVVTLMEPIENNDATLFAESFWLFIGQGMEPLTAYYNALDRSPPVVGEFAQLHM